MPSFTFTQVKNLIELFYMVQELSIHLIPQTGGIAPALSKFVMSITQFGHHKQGQTKVQREGGFTQITLLVSIT
jgi:hypothetical protein